MTVLQSLDRYYGRMALRGEASLPGYSRKKVDFVVLLSLEGRPVSVKTLRSLEGKRVVSQLLDVPAAVGRTAGIKPNLLWDKTAYSLGRTTGTGKRTDQEHASFKAENLAFIGESQDRGLLAFRRFLETWTPTAFDDPPFSPEMLDADIVFGLEGEQLYLHQREAVRLLLSVQPKSDGTSQICLVTGVPSPVARLHTAIKGIWNAQTSGAALVSFQMEASRSYDKSQGDNAPTSNEAVFRYTTALNRMLERGSRNRLGRPIAETTIVFWADTSDVVTEENAAAAENWFNFLIEPPDDPTEAALVGDALQAVADGRSIASLDLGLVEGTRFHILGLSASVPARPAVRYWFNDTFDTFAHRLAQHYQSLHIAPLPWPPNKPPSIPQLLVRTTAMQQKFENIPPLLAGEVVRAVLGGTPYPRSWMASAIIRLRAGDNPGTGWHAAVIKACLSRMPNERTPPVSLDLDNRDPAYNLGRLFAVLEAAQRTALGKNVNATIADRYYGAASATPARVFGALLRGARTHIADANRRNIGFWIEPQLQQIIDNLGPKLPRTLRLEDQGRFAIGYYHQRAYRPAKPETPATPEST